MPCDAKSMRTTPCALPFGSQPTRTAITLQPGAVAAMPMPLSVRGATQPAHMVPWLS